MCMHACTQASEEEYEMVNTAAANADRFYRTMSSSNAYGQDDASQAADAFRLVAQVSLCGPASSECSWSWS